MDTQKKNPSNDERKITQLFTFTTGGFLYRAETKEEIEEVREMLRESRR